MINKDETEIPEKGYPAQWDSSASKPSHKSKDNPTFTSDETSTSYDVDDGYWYPVNIVKVRTYYPKSGSGNWCLGLQLKVADAGHEETRGFTGNMLWINMTLIKGNMRQFNSVLVALGHNQPSVRGEIIDDLKTEGKELSDKAPLGWEKLNDKIPVLRNVFLGQPLRVFVETKEGRDRQDVTNHRPWPEGTYLQTEKKEGEKNE